MNDITREIRLSDLACLSRWVAWQTEKRGEKPTKVPYAPGGGKARADEPTTWGTLDAAAKRAAKLPKPYGSGGVGLELGDMGDGRAIGGIDLDSCRDPVTCIVEDWAQKIITKINSYTEVSPSGTGVKVFFLYASPDLANLKKAMGTEWGKMFKRGSGEHPPAIELHLGNRYFAVTEEKLDALPLEFKHIDTEDLIRLIKVDGPAFAGKSQGAERQPRAGKSGATRDETKAELEPLVYRDGNPDLLAWINTSCVLNPRLNKRWSGDWSGLKDSSGSGRAFALVAELKREGLDFDDTVAALMLHPHTNEWTRTKGQSNNQRELSRIWERIREDDGPSPQVQMAVAEFNRKYFVVSEQGKTVVYCQKVEPILKRQFYERITFADLRALYLNQKIVVEVDNDGNEEKARVAEVWLEHPERKQYIGGITFDPSGRHNDPNILNLWQGFAVTPRPGSWDMMRHHMFEVLCCRDHERFNYLMNWTARMFQRPGEPGEVALVMRGGEGTGKGTFANAVKKLMGQHALKIANAKHLTGNFNAHLRDCIFLFADEAFFAGDPSHVGVLKNLITEDTLTIEAKYQNAVETPNFLHLLMASNEQWVVPASLDARRFFVLDVSGDRARDFSYFAAIKEDLNNGGYEAMLHDLLNHDLTGFDVRDVPETEGLQEQKKLSLGTSEAWWLDVLHRGYVYKSKHGLDDYFSCWHETVTTEVLYDSYTDFAKAKHERRPMAREAFGAFMKDMGGNYTQPRKVVIGEHITDVPNPFGGTNRKAALITKSRARGYQLGTLQRARNAFIAKTNLAVEWEDEEKVPD